MTCRCPLCGRNNAGDNHSRVHFIRAGIRVDESGIQGKKHRRQMQKRLRQIEKAELFRLIESETENNG